ncbi:MAG: hypothetical protein DRH70_01470 [Candidatus Coatesbacteria bacterium]|nr:MAG: hypothetical protein DRH70_01470 [Candidatus Coatesbacteria bacterium]
MAFASSGYIRFVLLVCCLAFVGVGAYATSSDEFVTEGKGQFDSCDLNGVTLTDAGKIILSVPLEKTADLEASQVWAVAADSSGAIYAGTGDEGRLYVLRPGAKPEVLFDSGEQQIHSVLVDRRGRLYAGTGPSGIVFRVDRKTGAATKLFETGEKYVWSLASGPNGEIYAGTGPNGKVFKITGPGKGEAILELGAPNITSLTFDLPGNRLLIGTSSGVVYSFTGSGKPTARLEARGMEIRTILIDGKELYVLAMGSGGGGGGAPVAERPGMSGPPDVSSAGGALRAMMSAMMSKHKAVHKAKPKRKRKPSGPSAAKSAVYRIYPDGHSERIFRSRSGSLFCMDWFKGDLLIFGYRGDLGVVVRLNKEGDADLLRSIEDTKFVSACSVPGGGFALGTSETGHLFMLSPSKMVLKGSLVSKVQDAMSRAKWGNVSWDAMTPKGAKVQLFTRSGDVSKVDDSWGDWQGPLKDAAGSKCLSPEARYIQFKAVLRRSKRGDSPSLERVAISYIQSNLPPKIKSITIHETGEDPEDVIRSAKASGVEAKYEKVKLLERFSDMPETKTLRAITWQASDPNGDSLLYSVFLKPRGGSWQPVTGQTRLTFSVVDTSVLADGKYLVKVEASDGPSNIASEQLSSEKESDEFTIDNSAPEVKFSRVKRLSDGTFLVSGRIRDKVSNIASARYAVDLGRFQVLRAKDGVFDSREERFEVRTRVLKGAGHFIAIRVEDAYGNVKVARKKLIR